MLDKPVLSLLQGNFTRSPPRHHQKPYSCPNYHSKTLYPPDKQQTRPSLLQYRFDEFKYHLNRNIEAKIREKIHLDQNRNVVGFSVNMSAEELPGFDEELHQGVDKSLLLISNCRVCHVSMNAPTQAQQHYTGKNHSKKVRQYLERLKDMKDVTVSGADRSSNGARTAAEDGEGSISPMALKYEDSPLPNETTPSALTSPMMMSSGIMTSSIENSDYCHMCDVSFNSEKQAKQHYKGRNHARRKRINEINKVAVKIEPATEERKALFLCTVCHIQTTSQEQLKSHLRGAKHNHKLNLTHNLSSVSSKDKVALPAGGPERRHQFRSKAVPPRPARHSSSPADRRSYPFRATYPPELMTSYGSRMTSQCPPYRIPQLAGYRNQKDSGRFPDSSRSSLSSNFSNNNFGILRNSLHNNFEEYNSGFKAQERTIERNGFQRNHSPTSNVRAP